MNSSNVEKKNRVLIVDDVAFVRSALSTLLSENGFDVVGEASSGIEAIELFSKLSPDLVTMDVVMPKMSGIEAIRKLVKANPGARVVVISAMGQESLVMEAINAGAQDYILKPFSTQEVIETLKRTLANGTKLEMPVVAAGA
jgi:two-component system chemotaxis response regulator CheY